MTEERFFELQEKAFAARGGELYELCVELNRARHVLSRIVEAAHSPDHTWGPERVFLLERKLQEVHDRAMDGLRRAKAKPDPEG